MFSTGANAKSSGRRATRRSQSRASSVSTLQQEDSPPVGGSLLSQQARRVKRAPRTSGAWLDEAFERNSDFGRRDGDVLAQTEWQAITLLGRLPMEVRDVLRKDDAYAGMFRASLSNLTGYALLVSPSNGFVWYYTKASSSPTCYLFPVPPSNASLSSTAKQYLPLPLACLHEHGQAREPGLLLASITGELRFWETVSLALSGVDRYQVIHVALAQGEVLKALCKITNDLYIACTSNSNLINIFVTASHGRCSLSARPFGRSGSGVFGALSNLLGSSKQIDLRTGLHSVSVGPRDLDTGALSVFAVSDRGVEEWEIPLNGIERFKHASDVRESIGHLLDSSRLGSSNYDESTVQVLDVQTTVNQEIAVLFSYPPQQAKANSPTLLDYGIALFDYQAKSQQSLKPQRIIPISYQSYADPNPLLRPQLVLYEGGPATFVVFPNALVAASLVRGSEFSQVIAMKRARNQILTAASTGGPSTDCAISVLARECGFLLVQISLEAVVGKTSRGRDLNAPIYRLKTALEQAIFFADKPENPLDYSYITNLEGDLIGPAEAISREILTSTAVNLKPILDMQTQLRDRCQRLRALIVFINQNGLLGRLSATSRRKLLWDAEKMNAALAMWRHQNSRMAVGELTLLEDALAWISVERGNMGDEADTVRPFFRTRVPDLAILLELLPRVQAEKAPALQHLGERSLMTHEANHLLLLVHQAILRTRADTASLYRVEDSLCRAEPWLASTTFIEVLKAQFDNTDQILRDRSREYGTALDTSTLTDFGAESDFHNIRQHRGALHADLKAQLCQLAEFLFSIIEERLFYLQTLEAEDPTSVGPELKALSARYATERARVLHILVRNDCTDEAYRLGDKFQDFRVLVELCTDPHHGSSRRTQTFIDKYREDFACELYRFLVETGQLKRLLEQHDAYSQILLKFLETSDNANIAWIHEFALSRYGKAYEQLMSVAEQEQSLADQKLILSVAKLSAVAACSDSSDWVKQSPALSVVETRLDLASCQLRLVSFVNAVFESHPDWFTLAPVRRLEMLVSELAPQLQPAPGFRALFSQLIAESLEGRVLSIEDLIDIYTLKTQGDEDSEAPDLLHALDIFSRSQEYLPPARAEMMLATIWRRIFTRDPWTTLSHETISDEQFATVLLTTSLSLVLEAVGRGAISPSICRVPSQVYFDSAPELKTRFPSMASDRFETLLVDYRAENERLADYLKAGLESQFQEILRLQGHA